VALRDEHVKEGVIKDCVTVVFNDDFDSLGFGMLLVIHICCVGCGVFLGLLAVSDASERG
jgi:hypothetical protein